MINKLKLNRLKINNFKNVKNGEIDFEVKETITNILGIYGQNGSGKTSVVEVLEIFKALVNRKELPSNAKDLIDCNEKIAKIELEFILHESIMESDYKIIYYFELAEKEESDKDSLNIDQISKISNIDEEPEKNKAVVTYERISLKNLSDGTKMKTPIIVDHSKYQMDFLKITPKPNYLKNIDVMTNLLLSRKLSYNKSVSFLFLKETFKTFDNLINEINNFSVSDKDSETLHEISLALMLLYDIADRLIISSNSRNGYLFSNLALPLSFLVDDAEHGVIRNIDLTLPIKGSAIISEMHFLFGETILNSINVVLPLIIPGLKIKIKVLNEEILKNGKKGIRVLLMAERNNQEIPFFNESDGIKKLVSILAGIIQIYNNPNNIFVVDEIDSGVFEFLLGELLTIVSDNAKGQLIFTSHNLRALEVLDYKNIVFTTTNAENRYLRPKNIKESNNLRSAYIRGIQVDTFEEPLYKSSNTSLIKLSLLKSKKMIQEYTQKILDELVKE